MTRAESKRQTVVARTAILDLLARCPATSAMLHAAVYLKIAGPSQPVAFYAMTRALLELRAEGAVTKSGKASGTRYRLAEPLF